MQNSKTKKWIIAGVILLVILGVGLYARKFIQNDSLPAGFASGQVNFTNPTTLVMRVDVNIAGGISIL